MILHIPHSSRSIPSILRELFLLSDSALDIELNHMTDGYTDDLFSFPDAIKVCFPISRLVVDVERFADDEEEPMSKSGMGMIYTKTSDGRPLKYKIKPEVRKSLLDYYNKHHLQLEHAVETELSQNNKALIIDCHSFPCQPLQCDINQDTPRPDFCIGTDSFHTPDNLLDIAETTLKEMGYSVGINWPYSGSLVPLKYYKNNRQVQSIMIEVNRSLYMRETSGLKGDCFEKIKSQLNKLLENISIQSNHGSVWQS